MAKPTNTVVTTGYTPPAGIGMREDLAEEIIMISPEETPVFSWLRQGKASNSTAHEWQTVSLRTPAKNAQPEGNQFVPTAGKATTRLVNACQIATEVAAVSGTSEAVDTAGDAGTLEFQMLIKGKELKRDLEVNPTLANQIRKITDPREAAGLMNFAATATTDVGVGGTKPTGDGATLIVEGTGRDLTLALVNTVLGNMWKEGARGSLMVMPINQKNRFDALAPAANLADNTYNLDVGGAPGVVMDVTVAIYKTSVGTVKIMLSQHMDDSTVLIFDERDEYRPKKCPLPGRDFAKGNPQLNHDGQSQAVIWEGTLEAPSPAAIGLIAGLNI